MVYRNFKFLHPRGRGLVLGHGQIRHKVRKLNFFKIRQTKYITMMNKEGSIKTMNFMTLRIRVVVLGRGHFYDKVKMLINLFS